MHLEIREKFLGKIVTVFTQVTGFTFLNHTNAVQYFTGELIDVTQSGLTIRHLQSNNISFYSFPILGIAQESFVSKNDPKYDIIKKELEEKKAPSSPKNPQTQYVSIDELTSKLKKAKS